jgi:hypothetical protein
MKSLLLPSADSPIYQWAGFVLFLLLLCVCLGGVFVWLTMARGSKAKRKRKLRHHRPTNPTLAQTGGLPPKRDINQPPPGP